MKHLNFLLFK